MRKFIIITLTCLIASACASIQPQPQYMLQNEINGDSFELYKLEGQGVNYVDKLERELEKEFYYSSVKELFRKAREQSSIPYFSQLTTSLWSEDKITNSIQQYEDISLSYSKKSYNKEKFTLDPNKVLYLISNMQVGESKTLATITWNLEVPKVKIGPAIVSKKLSPNIIHLICTKETELNATCFLTDKNNKGIDTIVYDMTISRENLLRQQLKKEEEAYWDKYRQRMQVAKKYCPSLIQQVQYMQYNPYAYSINKKQQILNSFNKYDCASYASDVMNGIEY